MSESEQLARWECYRAEIADMEQRLGKLARNFLDCGAWEDAAKCALKAEGLRFVRGRMPPPTVDSTKCGIAAAIAAVGTQAELAMKLGVTQQAVSEWERRGFAPSKRCDEISRLSGVPERDLMNPRLRKILG